MQRPNIHQLPQKKQSLTDLKRERESKNTILFKTRILTDKQKLLPTCSSKALN